VLVAVVLIVGSLLSVVAADDLVAQGQIRLSHTQSQTAAALTQQKQLQVSVAQLSAPQIVVTEARQLGMVAPTQIVDLPSVPLNVALPVPNTAPAAASSSSTSHTP
jgi:cell division protein FtsL